MNGKRNGLWIAVFGPDGVGKSAVIEHLERQLAPEFAGSSRFHFRPRFRRAWRTTTQITEPHAKPARGTVVSHAKLIYWLVDCWWGYLSTIIPRKRSGHLVVYDRYLPDVVVDPLRYRLPFESQRFADWLVGFAPEPDLYILLDAPADVVQRRKSEVSTAESHRQRLAYLGLFQHLRNKLLVDADSPIGEVSRRAAVGICAFNTDRLFNPSGRSSFVNL